MGEELDAPVGLLFFPVCAGTRRWLAPRRLARSKCKARNPTRAGNRKNTPAAPRRLIEGGGNAVYLFDLLMMMGMKAPAICSVGAVSHYPSVDVA